MIYPNNVKLSRTRSTYSFQPEEQFPLSLKVFTQEQTSAMFYYSSPALTLSLFLYTHSQLHSHFHLSLLIKNHFYHYSKPKPKMGNHKIQNHFDENAEWDQILSDLNLAPSHLSTNNTPRLEAEAAERALIEDTEDWNSILASIEQEAQSFQAYAQRDALLEQQRKIILDNQKRVEEEMLLKEIEIEQIFAREEHWRAEREPVNVEQNRRRNFETKIMLRCSEGLGHEKAFYSQDEELDALGTKAGEVSKTEVQRHARMDANLDTEEGGVLRTVITKCETPGCEQCKAAANIKLEEPGSSIHFDGGSIIPVIPGCRMPLEVEDLDPNNGNAYTAVRSSTPPLAIAIAKGKSKKSKSSRLAIDWNISPDSAAPGSQEEKDFSPMRTYRSNKPPASFVKCGEVVRDDFGDDDFMGNNL